MFDQPVGVVWSAFLRQIWFGGYFNQPIASFVWPPPLQYLSLGFSFIQTLNEVVWPAPQELLDIGGKFNQFIDGIVWPASLRQLKFGSKFNRNIMGVMWPGSIQQLSFGQDFNQPVAGVPSNIGSTTRLPEWCGPPPFSACRLATSSTIPSQAFRGRRRFESSSSRLVLVRLSIRPLWGLCGLTHFNNSGLGMPSTTPSPECCGPRR